MSLFLNIGIQQHILWFFNVWFVAAKVIVITWYELCAYVNCLKTGIFHNVVFELLFWNAQQVKFCRWAATDKLELKDL